MLKKNEFWSFTLKFPGLSSKMKFSLVPVPCNKMQTTVLLLQLLHAKVDSYQLNALIDIKIPESFKNTTHTKPKPPLPRALISLVRVNLCMAMFKAPPIDSNVQPGLWTNGLAHRPIRTTYQEAELRKDVNQAWLQLWGQAEKRRGGFWEDQT